MKILMLLFVLLGIATIAGAQEMTTSEREALVNQTYSEQNRQAIGCQDDAWEAIRESRIALAEKRKLAIPTDWLSLQDHILDCATKADALRFDKYKIALTAIAAGNVTDATKQAVGSIWYLSEIINDAFNASDDLKFQFLLQEDASLLKDYLALIDKYNNLVVLARHIPNIPAPIQSSIPRELECTSYTAGSITRTTCH